MNFCINLEASEVDNRNIALNCTKEIIESNLFYGGKNIKTLRHNCHNFAESIKES